MHARRLAYDMCRAACYVLVPFFDRKPREEKGNLFNSSILLCDLGTIAQDKIPNYSHSRSGYDRRSAASETGSIV